jgi:hypothetical protein
LARHTFGRSGRFPPSRQFRATRLSISFAAGSAGFPDPESSPQPEQNGDEMSLIDTGKPFRITRLRPAQAAADAGSVPTVLDRVRNKARHLRLAITDPVAPSPAADVRPAFEVMDRGLLAERRICLFAPRRSSLHQHLGWLNAMSAGMQQLTQPKAVGAFLHGFEPDHRLLIVDIDCFEETSEAVDTLIFWRTLLPGTPMIIGSASFSHHDFSMERRAISDASVRLPCGKTTLMLAIGCAIRNTLWDGK